MMTMIDASLDVERARDEAFPAPEPAPAPAPKRRGAPKGRVPWNKGKRTGTASKGAPEPAPEPVEPSPEEVAGLGFACSVIWELVGRRVGLESLTEDEAVQLGAAAARVVKKYMPSYGQYDPEIGLALVLVALVGAKYKGKPEPTPQPTDGADLELGATKPPADPRTDPNVQARFGR